MQVLLINPKFPHSYWSFEETNKISGHRALLPPLGLITAGALLPLEWELRLVDLNARCLSHADWNWPDLVMLTAMVIQQQGLLALIKEAKQRGKTVVVGGPYVTSVPQEVLAAGADFLVCGEGENAIPLWLEAMQTGQKRGIFQAEEKPSMTASPVPRFDLLKLDDYDTLAIQTSRGCPFECEFCDVINLYGRLPRYKNPSQILSELTTLYRLGWRGGILISDDNFIGNKAHAREILRTLIPWMKDRGHPFSFWTQTSVNLGQDLAMIDLLTEANFSHIFLGIESPDQGILSANRKYQNLKNPMEQSLANITANGLSPVTSFIIGFDGEEKGAAERICTFVENNDLPLVMLNTLQVLPNTALWDRLQREGRLLEKATTGDNTMGGLNYLPTRPQAEIMTEYREMVNRLYEPSGFLKRAFRHILAMRPTRQALRHGDQENRQTPKIHRPRGNKIQQLSALVKLIWRQGIQGPCRWQFWRQLAQVYQQNPSRLIRYLHTCGLGENLFRLRREILKTNPPN
ncbi:MAG: B12-binding domain-containing radical SAM protein [Desulfobaccales bacterium]